MLHAQTSELVTDRQPSLTGTNHYYVDLLHWRPPQDRLNAQPTGRNEYTRPHVRPDGHPLVRAGRRATAPGSGHVIDVNTNAWRDDVGFWHECDIARSQMDGRFRG